MSRAVSIRLDEESLGALASLEQGGLSRSEAIRLALCESAAKRKTRSALRADAARIARDDTDRREMAAIMSDLDEISEPW